jgi:hypothetical protein
MTATRTVLCLARVEAFRLVRSLLVLAGLLAAGAAVWVTFGPWQPLWWNASWQIGFGQLVLAMAVLAAAQLAAGRARRDAMADLYASFPATAGTRTAAQLTALAGAAPASVVLIAAAVVVARAHAAIGAPDVAVLAGGVVLVIAAGAIGVAIGSWFAHPLAGALGALALLFSSATSHLATGADIWLAPWQWNQDALGSLPGPLPGYPPVGAHVLELAGIAAAAGTVALAATAGRGRIRRSRIRGGLAAAGVLAAAAICVAGALQLRPIPTASLNRLVSEAAAPASVQACATDNDVRYCLYPGFAALLPSLEAPVNGVLAHLPARPGQPLTVSQVLGPDLLDPTLTHGHPAPQVSAWQARTRSAPGSAASASAIYLPVGSWPAASGQLGDARFEVALAAAEWAVRLSPTVSVRALSSDTFQQCVPLNQAREAIAIYLAILATHPPAGELRAGLGTGRGFFGSIVGGKLVPDWVFPGFGAYLTPQAGPENTAAGYLLASAMAGLPEQQIARVLARSWGSWLNWHVTDAQLAAALGIRMPSVPPAPPLPGPGGPGGPAGPQAQLCTT